MGGYRMGEYAIGVLGLEHGSFDLEVVHFTPREVQYACIANGAADATGVSVGAVYQYLPSKESLVAALVDAHVERHMDTFCANLRAFDGPDLRVRVRAIVDRCSSRTSSSPSSTQCSPSKSRGWAA